jgi:hypothetical protein
VLASVKLYTLHMRKGTELTGWQGLLFCGKVRNCTMYQAAGRLTQLRFRVETGGDCGWLVPRGAVLISAILTPISMTVGSMRISHHSINLVWRCIQIIDRLDNPWIEARCQSVFVEQRWMLMPSTGSSGSACVNQMIHSSSGRSCRGVASKMKNDKFVYSA